MEWIAGHERDCGFVRRQNIDVVGRDYLYPRYLIRKKPTCGLKLNIVVYSNAF